MNGLGWWKWKITANKNRNCYLYFELICAQVGLIYIGHGEQRKQNLFLFCTHACNEYMNRMALVSLPDNVFQLFFTLLHGFNISCWWCLMMCKAIRCWNIRNSRIFFFWFCIVRACNYKRQNPPTLQKEKKKGTYIWAKVTYIYSKSLAETISLKIVRMQV